MPWPGLGEDQDRRCEDVELTALPLEASQVERGGRRALGRDYGCNCEKGANRNEDFPEIDFVLSRGFFRKRKVSSRLVISWWAAACKSWQGLPAVKLEHQHASISSRI